MTAWLSQWMSHPLLFVIGVLLVSVPILIYLLNKRRFRVVDWSAMDFLIEVEQLNRRRVRLEEWLLLALRCLLVLLIGLLVARPYFSSRFVGGLLDQVPYERIILLDDSPSMSATLGDGSAFHEAKLQLVNLVRDLAERDVGDSLTLILTSRSNWPVFIDLPINAQSVAAIVADIDALQQSDMRCRWDHVCSDTLATLRYDAKNLNRVVYLLTDLRRTDWILNEVRVEDVVEVGSSITSDLGGSAQADALFESVRKLSGETSACFIVDFGVNELANLAVSEIVVEDKLILAGSNTRFNVQVRNYGQQVLRDVPIRFFVGDSGPLSANVESIPADGTVTVPFSCHFSSSDGDILADAVEVRAQFTGATGNDAIAKDNVRYFAARVRNALSVLIVDGDLSTEYGKSESFYLQRALTPPGSIASGIQTDIVNESEFELKSLGNYQVIFLCNVYRLSESRAESLRAWVETGGGLVVFPSGQADEQFYDQFYARGEGLLPRRLVKITGDEAAREIIGFNVVQADHPVVRVFQGEAAALLDGAKIFRWWKVDDPASISGLGTVVLRLTDADRTPALVERMVGKGRVAQFCFGADADWTDWPRQPSYVILLQELTRFMAQAAVDHSNLVVGESIRQTIDINEVGAEAIITNPKGESVSRQAALHPAAGIGANTAEWAVNFDDTQQCGFYRATFQKPDGRAVTSLIAVNLHAADSDLNRIDRRLLESAFEGSNVRVVAGDKLFALATGDRKGELWFWVLLVLVFFLFCEQFFAWKMGRPR